MAEPPEHRACRQHAPGERPRGRILDGPFAGSRTITYGFRNWPLHACSRSTSGGWRHHVHEGGGAYRYAGLCADHHDPRDLPDDWPTGCGGAVDKAVDNERSRR